MRDRRFAILSAMLTSEIHHTGLSRLLWTVSLRQEPSPTGPIAPPQSPVETGSRKRHRKSGLATGDGTTTDGPSEPIVTPERVEPNELAPGGTGLRIMHGGAPAAAIQSEISAVTRTGCQLSRTSTARVDNRNGSSARKIALGGASAMLATT